MLTHQTIAEHLDLSQPGVSVLMKKMALDYRKATIDEVRVAYIRHLRDRAAGRSAEGGLDLAAERAALAKVQRERIEMQNAITRRDLAPVIVIEEVLAKAGSRVAGILDAIPGMVKRRSAAVSSDDLTLIAAEVAKARNIAASVTLGDLQAEIEIDD